MQGRSRPSTLPFVRHLVMAYRLEMGQIHEDRFYVFEHELTIDDLRSVTMPPPLSEEEVRDRLTALGLSEADIDARLTWAKLWMTTRTIAID